MIVPFIDDESAYAAAFEQTGYGMPHLTYLTLYHKLNRTSND